MTDELMLSSRYNAEEEYVDRRFKLTLIDERARLKDRLDALQHEHMNLLGRLRMVHEASYRVQEEASKAVQAKANLAQKRTDEARALFVEAGELRAERDALLGTTAEMRGQLGRLSDAHDDLKAKHADRSLALEKAEAAGSSAAAQLQASEAMTKELQEQLDDARSQVRLS